MGIPEKFGFPFFMYDDLSKLHQFMGATGLILPLIGDVGDTSGIFLGHWFGHKKNAKSKL